MDGRKDHMQCAKKPAIGNYSYYYCNNYRYKYNYITLHESRLVYAYYNIR